MPEVLTVKCDLTIKTEGTRGLVTNTPPFLTGKDTARGAHAARHVRVTDESEPEPGLPAATQRLDTFTLLPPRHSATSETDSPPTPQATLVPSWFSS